MSVLLHAAETKTLITFVWQKNVGGIPREVPTPDLAHIQGGPIKTVHF